MRKTLFASVAMAMLLLNACVSDHLEVKDTSESDYCKNTGSNSFKGTRAEQASLVFDLGERNFLEEECQKIERDGFCIGRIPFSAEKILMAAYKKTDTQIKEENIVACMQYMVSALDATSNKTLFFYETLIPTEDYYNKNKNAEYDNLYFGNEHTDFSGLVIRTSLENYIISVASYTNGICNFRVSTTGNPSKRNIIKEYLKSIFSNIRLFHMPVVIPQTWYWEEVIEFIDNDDGTTEIVRSIEVHWIEDSNPNDEDDISDVPGSGGKDPTQIDGEIYKHEDNDKWFNEFIYASTSDVDDSFSVGTVLAMALHYYGVNKLVNTIFDELSSKINGDLNLFPNNISQDHLRLSVSTYFLSFLTSKTSFKNNIDQGFPIISCYNSFMDGGDLCALIIGYKEDGRIIYYSPREDTVLVRDKNDFIDDLSFALMRLK